MGAKFLAVAKEVETDVDETLAELGAGEVGGGCAVKDELADVLAEAAADVEELGAGLKTGEEAGVEVVLGGEGEFEKVKLADAGPGEGFPGGVALRKGKKKS